MSPDPEPSGRDAREGRGSYRAEDFPATDVLSIVNTSSRLLLTAENDTDVLRILLSAAADLGAAKPKAGLWRVDDMAYAMWFLDPSGEAVPCGSAPAALYAGAVSMDERGAEPAPVMVLGARSRRWGVLDVSNQITDRPSLNALSLLARSAVLRLEAAGAGEEDGADSVLLDAMERWWSTPTTEALVRAAIEDVPRQCDADSCALTLLDPLTGSFRILFSEDLPQRPEDPLPWRTMGDDRRSAEALRRVLSTGHPIAFRWSPMTEALKEGLLPTGPTEGSYVAHPMSEAGRVIGVLDIYSREPRHFGPAQDAVMGHAARTLARIVGQRDRAMGQAEANRRQDILVGVTGLLAQQMDLKPIAEVLARTARQMWPDSDLTYAMLPQVEGGLWSIAALETDRTEGPRQGWARAGEGFAGWVIQTKQPLTISAALDDPRRGSLDRGHDVAAGMWVPMRRGDSMFGLLAVASMENGRAYGPDDQEALERLADQGAVALERTRERHGTQSAFWDAIEAIAGAIDARDGYTHGHSRNVTEYAIAMAQRLGLTFADIQTLRASALLHDIGKIGIPDHILNKPGALTPDERTIMESHPEIGYEILLRAPSLQGLLPGVRYHHERPDGRGYPVGMGDEVLPLQARIIAVADAFDAMTSDRVYRKRLTVEKAMTILSEGRGGQWDTECVNAFLEIVAERATPRLQLLAAEDSGREYLPSLGTDVFGQG